MILSDSEISIIKLNLSNLKGADLQNYIELYKEEIKIINMVNCVICGKLITECQICKNEGVREFGKNCLNPHCENC